MKKDAVFHSSSSPSARRAVTELQDRKLRVTSSDLPFPIKFYVFTGSIFILSAAFFFHSSAEKKLKFFFVTNTHLFPSESRKQTSK